MSRSGQKDRQAFPPETDTTLGPSGANMRKGVRAHARVCVCVRVCEREKEVGIFSYVLWMSPKKHQQERLRGLQLAPGLRAGTRVGPAAPPLTPSSRGGCCLLRVFTPMLSSPQQKVSLRTHPYNLLFQACVNTAQNTHTHTHTAGTQRPSL